MVAMQTKRSGVGLAVVGGQLLAVGGFDGVNYLKTVEILDSENGSWRLCSGSGNMHNRRLGGGVGVVKLNTPFSSYAHKGRDVQIMAKLSFPFPSIWEHCHISKKNLQVGRL